MRLKLFLLLLIPLFLTLHADAQQKKAGKNKFFEADNKYFQYTGRIDFSNPKLPRFWNAGVYINARFKGRSCEVVLNDEEKWGKDLNYITVVIDDKEPVRLQTTGRKSIFKFTQGLSEGEHTITICKNTESVIGYVEFAGLKCEALLPPLPRPERKIEFIGNSITCGAGMYLSSVPCDSGKWFDQHYAYLSYGPLTARTLNAQWHLSSVSGIGLIHSCCNMDVVMPQVFDKISMRENQIPWDFKSYTPDVLTICLGQNDGIQDSIAFCSAYVDFIGQIRKVYPNTRIVCLISPMANDTLTAVLKKYLTGVVDYVNRNGDNKVSKYFFSRSFNSGCGGHPDLAEHKLIAAELTAYLRELMKW